MVGVSRGTASVWLRDIELTSAQHAALRARNPAYNGQRAGAAVRSSRARERRVAWQGEGRAAAQRGDPLHAAGCMLYWAEGSKSRNAAQFTNSDPEVMRFFVRFLRTYFEIRDEEIRVGCNFFADHLSRQRELERFWLDVLNVRETSLCKSRVNVYSKLSQRKRLNRLPYGTCRVTVNRTAIVQHIFGAIQEYGGFDRPEWLDALRSEVPPARS